MNINIHHKNRLTEYVRWISQILLATIPNTFMIGMVTHSNQHDLSELWMKSQLMSAMKLMAICHVVNLALTLCIILREGYDIFDDQERQKREAARQKASCLNYNKILQKSFSCAFKSPLLGISYGNVLVFVLQDESIKFALLVTSTTRCYESRFWIMTWMKELVHKSMILIIIFILVI